MKSSVASAIAVFEEKLATCNTSGQAGSEHSENNERSLHACRSKRRCSLAVPLPGKALNKEKALDSSDKVGTSSLLQQGSKECVSPLRRRNSLMFSASPKASQVVDYSKVDYSKVKAGIVGSPFRSIAPDSAPSSPTQFSSSSPHRRCSMTSMDHKQSLCRDFKVEAKISSYPTDQRWSSSSTTKTTSSRLKSSPAFPIPLKLQVQETTKNPFLSSCNDGICISETSDISSTSDFTSPKGHYVMHQVRRKVVEPSLQGTAVMPSKLRRHSIIGSTTGGVEKNTTSQSTNNKVAPTISQYEAMFAGKKEPKTIIQSPIAKKGRRSSMTSADTTKGSPRRRDTSMTQKNAPSVFSPKRSGRKDSRLLQSEESNGEDSFGVDSLADITEAFVGCSSPSPLKTNKAMVSRTQALRNRTLDLPFSPNGRKSQVCGGDSENADSTVPTSHDHATGPPLRPSRRWGLSFDGSGPMVDAAASIAAERSVGNENEDDATGPPLRSSRQWGLSFYGSLPLDDLVAEKFNAEAVDTNSTTSSADPCESTKRPPKMPVREMMRPVPRTPDQLMTDTSARKKPDPSSSFLETTTASTTVSTGSASNAQDMPSDEDITTDIIQGGRKIVQNDEEDDVISTLTEDNNDHVSDERLFPSWDDLLRSRQRATRKKADAGIVKLCSGSLGIKDRLIQFQCRGPTL